MNEMIEIIMIIMAIVGFFLAILGFMEKTCVYCNTPIKLYRYRKHIRVCVLTNIIRRCEVCGMALIGFDKFLVHMMENHPDVYLLGKKYDRRFIVDKVRIIDLHNPDLGDVLCFKCGKKIPSNTPLYTTCVGLHEKCWEEEQDKRIKYIIMELLNGGLVSFRYIGLKPSNDYENNQMIMLRGIFEMYESLRVIEEKEKVKMKPTILSPMPFVNPTDIVDAMERETLKQSEKDSE